jgi:hypothetical protein
MEMPPDRQVDGVSKLRTKPKVAEFGKADVKSATNIDGRHPRSGIPFGIRV